ncbi:DNA translocase FtsK 4TM domain-containing protein [Oceanidesulfovibrio marinus]|uniref:Uncharacterized protein n=1 Tax=Oceanidesulfovibrio marinus TaxID=370038 RepID=A0A6P1ZPK8_9BACT|nr:DNA translocase FtsK 4TM domain-containing protein [Oceanidesulfovibrio marinus]TVM36437.1 hypothetical protein DQK91_00490 [Oceanidesulfovibrio marinus]
MGWTAFVLDNLSWLVFVAICLVVLVYVLFFMKKDREDDTGPKRTPYIPYMDRWRPNTNPGALAGAFLFLAGGMPFLLGFPLLLIILIGVGVIAIILEKRRTGNTPWPMLVFTVGLIAAAIETKILIARKSPLLDHTMAWVAVMAAGLVVALISLWYGGRRTRRSWKRIQARVLDKEIYKDISYADGGEDTARTWCFQLLCEFELNGETYQVTPGFWRTFGTESGVKRFLARAIDNNGRCALWVNPQNPLQAELVGRDVKDVLLH